MKLYTILHPVVFIGVFLWMGYEYMCSPDETPTDTTIEQIKAPSI